MKIQKQMGYKHPIKDNNILQYILVMAPLGLFLLYMFLMTADFARVYGTAYKNAETIKSDDAIIGVVSWDVDDEGKYVLLDTEGNEKKVEKPEISITMNDKELAYYSEESNMLMQPVDTEYVTNMLIGYNTLFVFGCMGIEVLALMFTVIKGDFSVLSKKRFLIVMLGVLLVSCGVIGIYYWMFM